MALPKYLTPNLWAVVDGRENASLADLGIAVVGKTGIIQNAHGLDHANFVSFVPADQPQIAVAVFIAILVTKWFAKL